MSENSKNLVEGLAEQIKRVQGIYDLYMSTPNGQFAAVQMKEDIYRAIAASGTGDIVKMALAYKKLKEWQDG